MNRLQLTILIGLIAAGLRIAIAPNDAGDLTWPLCAGRALVGQVDPYSACLTTRADGTPWASNPLTTALALLPFAVLPDGLAAAGVMGLACGLLAWALLRDGDRRRLAVFASPPFVAALAFGQWSPLLAAVALLPALLPLTLVKPHIGLSIALTRLTWRRAAACAIFGLASLLIMPAWPVLWLKQTSGYDGFFAILHLTGAGVLLVLLRPRDRDSWFAILTACLPQRHIYDSFVLAAIPKTGHESMVWALCSWGAFVGGFFPNAGRAIFLASVYWPIVWIILTRPHQHQIAPVPPRNTHEPPA